jgi:aminoglycoside/choline kinase family phosphotransferase
MVEPTYDADLSASGINRALGGQLSGTVVATRVEPIGTGQMADSARVFLTYDRDDAGPATIVAKFPSHDPISRATALAVRNYEIETSFYRVLAPQLAVRAPHCLHVSYQLDTDSFLLLLEDLAPARTGDQLAGCSVDQAALAVSELPRLHAPRWGDPALAQYPWLHRASEDSPITVVGLYQAVFPGFADRYASRLDADVLALAERFTRSLPAYQGVLPEPNTVVHGDYRLDNLLFGTAEGGPPVGVVDWQTVYHGPGVADLAYFLGAGLLTDERRAHEVELVRLYGDGMAALGVSLDPDELWEQYRRFTMGGVIMAVIASMIVQQTDRGDDMFMAMANRHGRHALDLDAEQLFN